MAAFEAAGLVCLLDRTEIASPCLGILRPGHPGQKREEFLHQPCGRGYTIDRVKFDLALRDLAMLDGVEFVQGRVRSVRPVPEGFSLCVTSAVGTNRVFALNVVDATGRPAVIARRLGGKRLYFSRLTARRLPATNSVGPWLQYSSCSSNWSYSLSGPSARNETWEVSASRQKTGEAAIAVTDASTSVLQPSAQAGWIAIGDAAAAFDPIYSQGLSHAIGTAIAVAGIYCREGTIASQTARDYDQANFETAQNSVALRSALMDFFD